VKKSIIRVAKGLWENPSFQFISGPGQEGVLGRWKRTRTGGSKLRGVNMEKSKFPSNSIYWSRDRHILELL